MVRYTESELSEAVANSKNIGQAIRYMTGSISGAKYATVKKYIDKWNICTAHFDVMDKHRKQAARVEMPLEQILVVDSPYLGRNQQIKKKLLAADMIDDVCSICNQGNEHNGFPLVLQLDHINGDNRDNRIENLRIVCPNCHTQTKTWGNKKRE
mgnify:CR=1 FL=1